MGWDSKKDVHLDGTSPGSVSRLEALEGPSGRRVRSGAEGARIVAESLLPGAQVSEVARKYGTTRWQIYWRRRFRQRALLAACEASQPTFAPLVVGGALEERQAPAIKLEIAIGDIVLRTDTAIDTEQLFRVIRVLRGITMIAAGADLKIYVATRPIDFRCGHDGLRRRCRRCFVSTRSADAAFVFRLKRADRIKILV
ncbi:IS66 family insertion sequence element accessory protein TnpB [Bradyrhizobium yuanmingense]|nr:IS66 family insertion sequence element accessory protein TnpB [Bradyrhizobium sp. CB1024]UWU83314.1 IS66 family insertion sequence element accessory protein TnpB [Bradyrhizobium sp. CB1024]